MQKIDIRTRDGVCPTYVYRPQGPDAGHGPWPAAIMFMDGPGMRPAIQAVAERLADHGYFVLLPDLFYRSGPYAPIDPKVVFTDPKLREAHRETLMNRLTPEGAMSDAGALLDRLAEETEVKLGPVGVVGYCMGGRLAMLAAVTFGDRIGAMASFHGGGLANDTPDSPHLQADRIKAKVYVAGAVEDASFTDAQKAMLETALTQAGVDHVVETYPARHGWVPRDMPAHDPAEAEHHWRALTAFFDGALKG